LHETTKLGLKIQDYCLQHKDLYPKNALNDFIDGAKKNFQQDIDKLKEQVHDFACKFPIPGKIL